MRFQQPLLGALLHPLGIVALLAIQWVGLVRWLSGKPVLWKNRSSVFSEQAVDGNREALEQA